MMDSSHTADSAAVSCLAQGADVEKTKAGRIARIIEGAGNRVSRGANMLAAVSLLVIAGVNVANVVARYLFSSPFAWAEELMIYLMILIVFAGCVSATWHQIHIRIDLLIERLGPAARAMANGFVTVVGVGALIMIARASLGTIERLYRFDQRSLALEAPLWIPQSLVLVGLAIVAVLMVVRLVVPGREKHAADPQPQQQQ